VLLVGRKEGAEERWAKLIARKDSSGGGKENTRRRKKRRFLPCQEYCPGDGLAAPAGGEQPQQGTMKQKKKERSRRGEPQKVAKSVLVAGGRWRKKLAIALEFVSWKRGA